MRITTLLAAALIALPLASCGGDESTGSGGSDELTWTGGQFLVTANHVSDGCLDGAANIVAFPEGVSEDGTGQRQFESPLSFLGSADIPGAIKPKFIEPFGEQSTTLVKDATGKLSWDPPPTRTGVDLGDLNPDWAGCIADFRFTFEGTPVASGGDVKFDGKVGFSVIGENDDAHCPLDIADGQDCTVMLDMTATRQ